MTALLLTAAQTIIISMIIYLLQKKQERRDKVIEARAEGQKKESLLSIKLARASAEMANATLIAFLEHRFNGELKRAREAYIEADSAYEDFITEQAVDNLSKK